MRASPWLRRSPTARGTAGRTASGKPRELPRIARLARCRHASPRATRAMAASRWAVCARTWSRLDERQAGVQQIGKLSRKRSHFARASSGRLSETVFGQCCGDEALVAQSCPSRRGIGRDDPSATAHAVELDAAPAEAPFRNRRVDGSTAPWRSLRRRRILCVHSASVAATASARLVAPSRTRASAASRSEPTPSALAWRAIACVRRAIVHEFT